MAVSASAETVIERGSAVIAFESFVDVHGGRDSRATREAEATEVAIALERRSP
jgi:hypothetical protein